MWIVKQSNSISQPATQKFLAKPNDFQIFTSWTKIQKNDSYAFKFPILCCGAADLQEATVISLYAVKYVRKCEYSIAILWMRQAMEKYTLNNCKYNRNDWQNTCINESIWSHAGSALKVWLRRMQNYCVYGESGTSLWRWSELCIYIS